MEVVPQKRGSGFFLETPGLQHVVERIQEAWEGG